MLTKDAIAHFGSQGALARALGIKQPSIAGWGEIVPTQRQFQIEVVTNGALRVDPELIPREQLRPDVYRDGTQ